MTVMVGEVTSVGMMFAHHPRSWILVGLLLTTACSDDSGPGSSRSASTDTTDTVPSACDLVTTEEASAAMRKPMGDGEETDTDGGTLCTWLSTDTPSEGLDSPTKLEVALLPMRPSAQELIDTLANSTDHRVVPGLGDLAVAECSFGDTDHCAELFVVLGDQYLAVDMGNFTWPGDYATEDLLGVVSEVAGHAVLRVRR